MGFSVSSSSPCLPSSPVSSDKLLQLVGPYRRWRHNSRPLYLPSWPTSWPASCPVVEVPSCSSSSRLFSRPRSSSSSSRSFRHSSQQLAETTTTTLKPTASVEEENTVGGRILLTTTISIRT